MCSVRPLLRHRDRCQPLRLRDLAGRAEPGLPLRPGRHRSGLPETLIVSVTGDPVTPYGAGRRLAESFDGRLLTVEGERHTVTQEGISLCVNTIVANFLIDLETPSSDPRCTL